MKKFMYIQIMVSVVALAFFFLVWKVGGNLRAATIHATIGVGIFAFLLFTFFFLAGENHVRFSQMTGSLHIQFAMMYGIMAGVRFGLSLRVIIPVVLALIFASVFLTPSIVRAIKRMVARHRLVKEKRRLIKEEGELARELSDLKLLFSYRWAPPSFGNLENRLDEVKTRLAELKDVDVHTGFPYNHLAVLGIDKFKRYVPPASLASDAATPKNK